MTKTEALLPCPFCGSEKIDILRCEPDCCGGQIIETSCVECGCALPMNNPTEAEAIKAWNTRTPEGQEIRYRFPQSVIDDLKSAVKIFGSLSAEQDEQLGLKGGGYMSLESLLRRAESLPEGQEMFAMEHQGDGHLIMAHWVESVVLREAHEGNHDSQHEVYKVVSVLVTKKED